MGRSDDALRFLNYKNNHAVGPRDIASFINRILRNGQIFSTFQTHLTN